MALTLIEKIRARILERASGQAQFSADRHLILTGYAPAFEFRAARGLSPRCPERILASRARTGRGA